MAFNRIIRISVEQRCMASQALWAAALKMLNAGNPRAVEWEKAIGYDEMRYRCRCKMTCEGFYDARKLYDELGGEPLNAEDFAMLFLHVCVTKHSMNLNRDWEMYLTKHMEALA